LEDVDQTGEAPPGQQGGGKFNNDGRGGGQILPTTDANGNPITYQEWDVNPKQPGVNRGGAAIEALAGTLKLVFCACQIYNWLLMLASSP
jgi:hypothetical protein